MPVTGKAGLNLIPGLPVDDGRVLALIDLTLGRLALVIEGVEVLLETGVGGDAGVDGASEPRLPQIGRHGGAPGRSRAQEAGALPAPAAMLLGALRPERRPKKRWPFQLVPVIALAIMERLP